MKPYSQSILTLNARDNIMLEVIRDYFKLTNAVMHREIQGMHLATQQILASKGTSYSQLKSALVPRDDRYEAGFIFDSRRIDSHWYGLEVARVMLPLFDKRTSQSVLCGDLLGDNQDLIFNILDESLVLARSFEFVHGTLLYCVYVNNLTKAALQKLHQMLSEFPAYIGFIPATFSSRAKTYLSTTLVNSFLTHRNRVIMGHEDDRPNEENVNIVGYPFEEFGYEVCSLQASYFDVFLSYKIERAVFPGFEVDTEMSLNAVSRQVLPLEDCRVLLDETKYVYLKSEKLGKLKKAGISELDSAELARLIETKIVSSYIYDLVYLEEHHVVKFNLMIEVPRTDGGYPTKLTAALEFKPVEKVIRVITLH
jgi:hypothetical protein